MQSETQPMIGRIPFCIRYSVFVIRYWLLAGDHHDLHPAVLALDLALGLGGAEAGGADPAGGDTLADEVVADRLGPRLGELLVALPLADLDRVGVGVAFDPDRLALVLPGQRGRDLIEGLLRSR